MCSVLFAWQAFDEVPIVLAANRDERYDREAEGPRLLCADPLVLAPQDHDAGGTWLGVNEHGLVIAIANRPDGPEGERSRGLLVRDLLTSDTSDEARTYLAALLGDHTYAGFYLLIADPSEAFFVTWNGTLDGHELERGVHVLDNGGLDGHAERVRAVRDDMTVASDEAPEAWRDRAEAMLASHEPELCRHGDDHGTVSATTVTVATADEHELSMRHAPGPPCETAFEEVVPEGHI